MNIKKEQADAFRQLAFESARELLLQDAIIGMIGIIAITIAYHEMTAQQLQREIAAISRAGD